MSNLTFKLNGTPPKWVENTQWYYENIYKEQWIAAISENELIIAGSDIDWSEIKLTPEQVEEAYNTLIGKKQLTKEYNKNPLSEWIMDAGERLWVASVLHVAIEQFKVSNH